MREMFYRRDLCLTLICAFAVCSRVGSQDVGSFLAGLLGAAEAPSNETSAAQNQIPCPGECVHAFTSILCSRVIEQFDCGAGYLRCCVSNDFNFGTVVETSAPLPDEPSTDSSTEYEVFLVSTQPSPDSPITNVIREQNPSSSTPVKSEAQPTPKASVTTVSSTASATNKPGPCKGICVENIFVRYCSTTKPGVCPEGSTCCASSNQDEEDELLETTTYSIPISWATNKIKDNKQEGDPHLPFDSTPSSTTLPAPLCPGSCVAPLFSLLCDSVKEGYYCPNDGRCCMSNDETESPTTTTVSNFASYANPCPGACIPVFLRGMCNRPSELMIKADCEQDYVCCYQPDVKDQLHVESPQIPLLRPGTQQSGFPNVPLRPQQSAPPLQHPYPQRPHVPFSGKPVPPVIVPHVHQQGNGNQVYLGNGQTAYRPVPPVQPPLNNHRKPAYPPNDKYDSDEQTIFSNRPSHNLPPKVSINGQSEYQTGPQLPPHGNNPYNQRPYPQNINYGHDADDQSIPPNLPNFTNGTLHIEYQTRPQIANGNIPYNNPYSPNTNNGNNMNDQNVFNNRPQSSVSSGESSPVNFNGLPPDSSVETSLHAQTFQSSEKRRYNFTHNVAPLIPINHAPKYPPNGMHHDSSRFIPPTSIQNTKPVMQPEENTQRKPQNPPDRFVSGSVEFSPGGLRPIAVDFNHKPSHIERFQPPTPQENTPLIPLPKHQSNTSTMTDSTPNKPLEVIGSVHEVPLPQAIEPPKNTGFVPFQEPFRPVQNQHRPIQGASQVRPIHNQKPIQSPNEPRPPQTNSQPTKPIENYPPKPVQSMPQPKPIQEPNQIQPSNPIRQPVSNSDHSVTVNSTAMVPSIVNNGTSKKLKPECPGTCIGSFLKFTCFGNNAIYDGFSCEQEGTMCCTLVEHIKKYEEHIHSGDPLALEKPSESPKLEVTEPEVLEPNRRPGLYVCGIKGNQRRKSGRVVGGKTSSPGEWCWQVALINAKNQYLCGGALIGSRWVLTAAHCITALVRNGDAIYVRVGDYDLSSPMGSLGAQTQKVSTSYIHHNHNGQTLDNDVALLRLENPVQLQETVCLVCLPARGQENSPGKRCTVTGYGYMSESGPIALKIREAVLPIVEEKLCTEQVNKVTEKRFILPAGSFCAGGESGNDACQGDGGGPLTCENEGYHELTGLVSWGFGCGKENVPGVYVKVSAYIGWINQIISVNN